jgi:hypothetical protein
VTVTAAARVTATGRGCGIVTGPATRSDSLARSLPVPGPGPRPRSARDWQSLTESGGGPCQCPRRAMAGPGLAPSHWQSLSHAGAPAPTELNRLGGHPADSDRPAGACPQPLPGPRWRHLESEYRGHASVPGDARPPPRRGAATESLANHSGARDPLPVAHDSDSIRVTVPEPG